MRIFVPVKVVLTNVNQKLIGADLTKAQEISLATDFRSILDIYAKSDVATTFYLDISVDGTTWYNIASWSGVTSVIDTYRTGFPYAKLRSDPAGVAGNKVTLILSANPGS